MAPFSRYKPWWRGFVLAYFLLLLVLVGALVWQSRPDAEPVGLTEVVASEVQGGTRLNIKGVGLQTTLHGLLSETVVEDEARQWLFLQQLSLRNLAVSAREDLALVSARGNKLISLSLAKGRLPVVLGSLDMPGQIEQVRIIGDRVLVGLKKSAGVALVALEEPQAMRLLTVFGPTVSLMDLVADGQIVYLADRVRGVGVLDLAAESPQLGFADEADGLWRIALADKRLVAGRLSGAAQLYEILSPGHLKKVGEVALPDHARDLVLVDKLLAVATRDSLYLYDVSGWPRPALVTNLPLPGPPMKMLQVPGRDLLAISLIGAGVCLVDVKQPSLPFVAGHLKLPQTYYDLAAGHETIYASSASGFEAFSLEAITASRPAIEAQVSSEGYNLLNWNGRIFGYWKEGLTPLAASGVQAEGGEEPFLAIADKGKVFFYSRTDGGAISAPQLLSLETRGVSDVLWQSSRLYLAHSGGLDVLLGPRPDKLLPAGRLQLEGPPARLKVLGPDLLLVLSKTDGILIVDTTDPWQPVVRSRLLAVKHLPGSSLALDVLVVNQRAYVSLGGGGIHVFDISQPDQPRLIQMIDTRGYATSLALYDDLLLVGDGTEGVFMIDIRDPDLALPVGSFLTPVRAKEIAVADDGLLISSKPGGTVKLPLPQRLSALQVSNSKEAVALVTGEVSRAQLHLYDARGAAQIKVLGGK